MRPYEKSTAPASGLRFAHELALVAEIEVAHVAELDYKEHWMKLQLAGEHGPGRWLAARDVHGTEERS